jgi:predicted NBD/HSP70 family sugar kinase
MNNPIDSKRAGLRNEKLILSLLRKHGELSQAQLCKLAGLGSSTTSYIFARLREKKLILEKQGQSSKPGAKPKIVSINPEGLYIVSIEIAPANITAALFDFKCDMVEHFRIPLGSDHSVDNVIRLIEINVKGILSKQNITQDKLLGIGVTLSGSITPAGDVELSSPMGWKNVPLGDKLSEFFDCPVKIYTTKVRLLAEIGTEPELRSKNLMYLNVADGVGSTLWIEGNLLHGATNRFGEIGHIIIDPDGPRCGCGHKGCLEALISGPSLAERIKTELKNYPNSQLHSIKEDMTPEKIIQQWGSALRKNDQLAVKIRNFFADTLAKAASIAINCFDPEVILLAGYLCRQCNDYLTETIISRTKTDVYDNERRNITITPAKAGDLALIKGLSIATLQDSLEIR